MPRANLESALFHLIVDDDDDAMFMTNLVNGHKEIHVFVQHLVDDLILFNEAKEEEGEVDCIEVEVEPMDVEPLGLSEPKDDFYYGYFDNHDGGGDGDL